MIGGRQQRGLVAASLLKSNIYVKNLAAMAGPVSVRNEAGSHVMRNLLLDHLGTSIKNLTSMRCEDRVSDLWDVVRDVGGVEPSVVIARVECPVSSSGLVSLVISVGCPGGIRGGGSIMVCMEGEQVVGRSRRSWRALVKRASVN